MLTWQRHPAAARVPQKMAVMRPLLSLLLLLLSLLLPHSCSAAGQCMLHLLLLSQSSSCHCPSPTLQLQGLVDVAGCIHLCSTTATAATAFLLESRHCCNPNTLAVPDRQMTQHSCRANQTNE
jgi:hypothetical protein